MSISTSSCHTLPDISILSCKLFKMLLNKCNGWRVGVETPSHQVLYLCGKSHGGRDGEQPVSRPETKKITAQDKIVNGFLSKDLSIFHVVLYVFCTEKSFKL